MKKIRSDLKIARLGDFLPKRKSSASRTLCALRRGMFYIGKDRVDLNSFAAFLTQPDTVEFTHDGITIDTRAPFTRESWLFTHQITSYGTWTFLPLALPLTMHSARFELGRASKCLDS